MIRTRLTSQQAANVIIATVLLCGIPSYAQVESQKSAAQVEPATDTPNADSKKDGDLTPEAPVDATRISNASQVPDVCGIWKLIDPSGIALFKEIHIPKVLLMDESFEVNMYDSGSSFGSNKTISDFRWDAEQSQFVEVFTGKQRNANFKMAFRPVDEVSLEWTYFEDEETRIERQPLSPYPWSQYRDRDTLEQLKQSHNIFKRTGPLPTVFIEERDGLVVVTDDQGIAFFSRALGTWTRIAMGSQAIQRLDIRNNTIASKGIATVYDRDNRILYAFIARTGALAKMDIPKDDTGYVIPVHNFDAATVKLGDKIYVVSSKRGE